MGANTVSNEIFSPARKSVAERPCPRRGGYATSPRYGSTGGITFPSGHRIAAAGVGQASRRLLAKLDPTTIRRIRALNYLPCLTMKVDAVALSWLEQDPQVTPDILYRPPLN